MVQIDRDEKSGFLRIVAAFREVLSSVLFSRCLGLCRRPAVPSATRVPMRRSGPPSASAIEVASRFLGLFSQCV
jgi:hypothetical protein